MYHRINKRTSSFQSLQSKSFGSSEELSSTGTYCYSTTDNNTTCKYNSSFSSKSSGESANKSKNLKFEVSCKLIGRIDHVIRDGQQEGSLDLINVIDVAQCEERLPLAPGGEELKLLIDKNGVRLFGTSKQDPLLRVPLYKIERIVTYDDVIINDVIIALKVVHGCHGNDDNLPDYSHYDVHVFASEDHEGCQKIGHKFTRIIDSVVSSSGKNSQSSINTS